MKTSVIVSGARTPIGRYLGALANHSATDLGGIAMAAALQRGGVEPDVIDAVLFGNVVQAGVGPNPARIAAASAGIPLTVPATTINKLCLSGLAAVAMADQAIAMGQYDSVLAGGTESMSSSPHLLFGLRRGIKFGAPRTTDALETDALICAFDQVSMGAATERYSAAHGITRADQDAFAVRSHQRAAAAADQGRLAEEMIAVQVTSGREQRLLDRDEGVRSDIDLGALQRLRPAFSPSGTITAGSSSPLSDGAAAMVVMSRDRAEELGLDWIAEIGAYGTVGGPDAGLVDQPANAINAALGRAGLSMADVDLIEINEAFAAVALRSMALLDVDADRVNVNGGAIATGHPVGMSGARLVLAVALELRRRGGGIGVAALCGGGGQGDALVVRVPRS